MRFLITGATGFVGGHIAEACVERGWQVVAIARSTSATSILEKIAAIVHRGELTDIQLVRKALEEVDVVVHCAAKVGNWGPLEEYRKVNVEALRVLLEACKGRGLSRWVHMSSLGVYPPRHHYGSDETVPPPKRHRDSYSQTKVEAEQLVMHYHQNFAVPAVVLRPGFIYGPRDHTVLPKIIDGLRARTVRYPGGGRTALNTIFIRNLVDAVFLAVDQTQAIGQIYNLTDGEFVTKKRFIEAIADAMSLPHPRLTPPLWLAKFATRIAEGVAKLRGATEAPRFNYASLKFLGLNLDFSIDKARRELGYRPRVTFEDGIGETMAWYKQNLAACGLAPASTT
jgi:nucleoside-diphosphate-sugar epimerase